VGASTTFSATGTPSARRWIIGGALAVVTAINYLDRQTLPVVIAEIQKDIAISNSAFSTLQAMFLLSYAVMYAGGGWLVDRLGTRVGYALVAGLWSAACMAHAAAHTVFGLGAARFFLGLGEGGGFPASAKAVAEWFPARERSMAVGVFNTGSAVGAVLAPPLIAAVVLSWNWRAVFVLTGAAGLVWAALWGLLYRPAAAGPVLLAAGAGAADPESAGGDAGTALRWLDLLKLRPVWTLVIVKFLTDGAWFFFIFWLPKYLGDARGFKMDAIGRYAWIPYACAGVGSFVGGWLSAALIRRGLTLDRSRKIALGVSAALLPLSLLVVGAPVHLAIALVSLAFLGHQFWSVIVQTLPTDLFPARTVGSVAGLIGCAGSVGAMLFNLLVGAILDRTGNYVVPFFLAGIMHPLALGLVLLTLNVDRDRWSSAAAIQTRADSSS
jgi:ACS family hexuronate transporter-like MFS transporter